MSTTKANTKSPSAKDKPSIWSGKGPADKSTGSSSNEAPKTKKVAGQKKPFQPKLLLESDAEEKKVLIKVTGRTSVRQIVNFATQKIRDGWLVDMNGFQLEMAKVILAVEIIKTRMAFLHQQTSFLQAELPKNAGKKEAEDLKKEEPEKLETYVRNGIAIRLSSVEFQVTNKIGYQKPKPRVFL